MDKAHVRRKFDEALNCLTDDQRKSSKAKIGMDYCNRIFEMERSFEELTPEDRLTKRQELVNTVLDEFLSWLNSFNPAKQSHLGRAVEYAQRQLPYVSNYLRDGMLRICVDNYRDIHLRVMESGLPEEINAALSIEHEGIAGLNQMCEIIARLGPEDQAKLGAVATLVQPEYASQVKNLAENPDMFDFIPGIQMPEEYGRYMIRESGNFEYDDNLEGYYNFAGMVSSVWQMNMVGSIRAAMSAITEV